MSEIEDDNSLDRCSMTSNVIPGCCINAKSRTSVKPYEKVSFGCAPHRGNIYCTPAQWEFRKSSKKLIPNQSTTSDVSQKPEMVKPNLSKSDKQNIYAEQDYVISDYWKTKSDDISIKFIEPFKQTYLEDVGGSIKKEKLDDADVNAKSPPYTKEFHVLSEVQKARILKVVENVVKKLAKDDCCYLGRQNPDETPPGTTVQSSNGKVFCRKFSLPWVVIKVIEMVLCHVIQIVFLFEQSYYKRKNEFLPIVFTYYLTLLIVLISLIAQLSCFSYGEIQNPCYFMGVVSSCVLTLITSLGMIIMLSSVQYYKSFLQILVLVFVGILLCFIFAELCLFYVEVKNVWNVVTARDQSPD